MSNEKPTSSGQPQQQNVSGSNKTLQLVKRPWDLTVTNGDAIVTMDAIGPGGPTKQKIIIPKNHETVFVNHAMCTLAPDEFNLILGLAHPIIPGQVDSKVVLKMNPDFVKRLVVLLAQNVAGYEREGKINDPTVPKIKLELEEVPGE